MTSSVFKFCHLICDTLKPDVFALVHLKLYNAELCNMPGTVEYMSRLAFL